MSLSGSERTVSVTGRQESLHRSEGAAPERMLQIVARPVDAPVLAVLTRVLGPRTNSRLRPRKRVVRSENVRSPSVERNSIARCLITSQPELEVKFEYAFAIERARVY